MGCEPATEGSSTGRMSANGLGVSAGHPIYSVDRHLKEQSAPEVCNSLQYRDFRLKSQLTVWGKGGLPARPNKARHRVWLRSMLLAAGPGMGRDLSRQGGTPSPNFIQQLLRKGAGPLMIFCWLPQMSTAINQHIRLRSADSPFQ